MKLARRHFLTFAGAILAAPSVARFARAQAPEVRLKLHHFFSPIANAHTRLLTPWKKKVEQDSGGRIAIDLYPSMQLGGTPRQLHEQVRDGIADLVVMLSSHSPGLLPGLDVFELPFVADKKATVNAKAVQDFYEAHLRARSADVQTLSVWAHDGDLIHATRTVKTLGDLKGLKLHAPTRLARDGLSALGAHAVAMPVPQVPEALARKVIDGCVLPWEVVPVLKLQDALTFHTDFSRSPAFAVSTFALLMNKAKYAALPADLKKVLDANVGQSFARLAGAMWDDRASDVREAVKARGNTVVELGPEEEARWRKGVEPVIDTWLRETRERGLDGGKMLADARALLAKHAQG